MISYAKSPLGRSIFRPKGLFRSFFFFLEDEELAQNVVENDHDDVRGELHDHVVPAEEIDAQVHDEHVQKPRPQAGAEKRCKFLADLARALCLAVEHPAAVRHIGEQHAQKPRDRGADHRAAAERMREQPVGDIVYDRRQHAEEHVGDEILVFFIEGFQLFFHIVTSKFDHARRFLRAVPEEDGGAVRLPARVRKPRERALLKFAVEARERHILRAEHVPAYGDR